MVRVRWLRLMRPRSATENNRGRLVEGTWVLGIIDVHTGDLRIEVCPDNRRDAETLLAIIGRHVEAGTVVMTDCWRSYNGLDDLGFQHLTVNHSCHFVDPDTWANPKNRIDLACDEAPHMPRWRSQGLGQSSL